MLRNFVKLAYRNLLKGKAAALVNIFGLSVAIGCSIVVYLFLEMQFSMDAFHEHGDRIFLVENLIERDGFQQRWGDSPRPLGPALAADFPQVERAVRVAYSGGTFQVGDKVLQEPLWFVDNDFLEVFTFPLKYGEQPVFTEDNAIILSEALAAKYFGEENPVGRQLTVTFNDEIVEAFTVQGVAERFPTTASFRFNALIPYAKQRVLGVDLDDWEAYTGATFLQLRDPADLDVIAAGMDRYLSLQNAANTDWPIAAFAFENLLDLSLHAESLRGGIARGSHPAALVALPVIALFLLALACVNYMNIAIATATRRLKEIGVRKVIGSSKTQLVAQFLAENLLLCLLALLLGLAVAYYFLLPTWNSMFNFFGDDIGPSFGESPGLWLFLGGLLVLTAVASGAYPAFYVTRFQPTAIFRGRHKLGSTPLFTRALLTFQFVLAFITMIAGVVFTQNARFQSTRDWGYDQEHAYVVRLTEPSQYAALKAEVEQDPNVLRVAGSARHLGKSWGVAVLDLQGESMEAVRFDVGFGYLETLGLRLTEGRFFDEQYGSDPEQAVLVNETFARSRGWTEATGRTLRRDSTAYTIVGVVEDFHYVNFYDAVRPTVFFVSGDDAARYLSMKIRAGAGMQTADAVAAAWKRLFPDTPFDGYFQNSVFDSFYRETRHIQQIFTFVAVMALLISCMGLFGLAAQNVTRRMKEISIRKVLGATMAHVAGLVNRSFLVMLLIAAVLGLPLSYVLVGLLLSSIYEAPMPLGPLPFALAFVLILATALVTISSQLYRIATANPADVLRTE